MKLYLCFLVFTITSTLIYDCNGIGPLDFLGAFPDTADIQQGGSAVDTLGNPLVGLFGGLGRSLVLAGEKLPLGAAGILPNWFLGVGKPDASEEGIGGIKGILDIPMNAVGNVMDRVAPEGIGGMGGMGGIIDIPMNAVGNVMDRVAPEGIGGMGGIGRMGGIVDIPMNAVGNIMDRVTPFLRGGGLINQITG